MSSKIYTRTTLLLTSSREYSNKGNVIYLIYLDFRKVSDMVPDGKLLVKLGVSKRILNHGISQRESNCGERITGWLAGGDQDNSLSFGLEIYSFLVFLLIAMAQNKNQTNEIC